MNAVFSAAVEVEEFCRSQGWRFCFIGGVALQRWGEPRQTVDVDLTLLTGFGGEESFADALLSRFKPRRPDAREFALSRRVLLVENEQGVGIDIAFGALPFERGTVERASPFQIGPGRSILTCSAEDLVIHKCFASRPQDWVDVENILVKRSPHLNLGRIFTELTPLAQLKEEPGIVDQLRRLIDKVNRPA